MAILIKGHLKNEYYINTEKENSPDPLKIVFVQLGSPRSPRVSHVRSFLREFLGDPRVVDLPRFFWNIILYLFVLPLRPYRSAQAYARIWDGKKFPLISNTQKFIKKMAETSGLKLGIEIDYVFLLSRPRFKHLFDRFERNLKNKNLSPWPSQWLIVPLFPQFSESTSLSGYDLWSKEILKRSVIPNFQFLTNFHRSCAFIDNSVRLIQEKMGAELGQPSTALVISFHGIPKRRVLFKNDPYYLHCSETYILLKRNLKIEERNIFFTFQSRFGSEEWLTPYTEEVVCSLPLKGFNKCFIYCPSFVSDCLETTDEIGNEMAHLALKKGVEVIQIPCLNDDSKWAFDFAHYLKTFSQNKDEVKKLEYVCSPEEISMIPDQKMQSEPLSKETTGTLKIVFLTLFLDLLGFSIIFPLFPALAKYYLTVDSQNIFLRFIFDSIASFTTGSTELNGQTLVLFGGALGAIYSLLQFIAAPLWGGLSDRYGRKPILLVSIFGLFISYVLWFFSGSFTLLILARLIGGIMGGNISTATAVVADITSEKNRSKGMAIIGIAFALGFIFGPAIGGILSLYNLLDYYPDLATYGVNPFSLPALVAAFLSLFNLFYLQKKFKETLSVENRGKISHIRSSNPFRLFKPLPYPGLNLTNFSYFFFLASFSGMEFTLTFFAHEKLGMSSFDNGMMFIYIGFLIALVQGGYVRRKASMVGEKKMALQGLTFLIPGLLIIAFASTKMTLYFGLFFLAVGSAMAIPCLTALASLYAPSHEQGHAIGVFRSLGALARVVGPIFASLMYWKWGASSAYIAGATSLLIPISMLFMLPKVKN